MRHTLSNIFLVFILCISLYTVVFPHTSNAASVIEKIKEKIDIKAEEIKKLEKEITRINNDLSKTAEEKKSLINELTTLGTVKKKLGADIKLTETTISKTLLTIDDVSSNIDTLEEKIEKGKSALLEALQGLQNHENDSLLETALANNSLTEAGAYIETTNIWGDILKDTLGMVREEKQSLEQKKGALQDEKNKLSKFKQELSGKHKAVADSEKAKDSLLLITKNQEANYKKILEEKIKVRDQFEKDLFQFESELKLAIDPSKLPKVKSGVLSWPVDSVYITQNFGATVAAKRLYVSGSHNGLDLRAVDATPIKASLSGVVQATGNTDIVKGCYSYGKWVLLKHSNGISTLYAHLSSISVSKGEAVATGDIIAYSGRTGYVTGPHLHLTVLASEGVQVTTLPSGRSKNCTGATIPIADPSAYLDPILYLPKL